MSNSTSDMDGDFSILDSLPDEHKREVIRLVELFAESEQKLKSHEQTANEVYIPAINELRYASHHFLQEYLRKGDLNGVVKAQNHCNRAILDVIEAAAYFYLEQIRLFQEDYRNITVVDIYPAYLESVKRIDKVREIIKSIPLGEGHNRDHAYLKELENGVIDLRDIASDLSYARIELNKKMRQDWRNNFYALIMLIITVIATIAAVLALK